MSNFRKILLMLAFTAYTAGAFPMLSIVGDSIPPASRVARIAQTDSLVSVSKKYVETVKKDVMNIKITINSNSHINLKNIPTSGYLEVYTILGQRIKRLDLKKCKDGASLDLASGLYIIRAGKVAQKIIVK